MLSIQGEIRQCLENVKRRIQDNISSHGRTASGRSAASLTIEETSLLGGILSGSTSFLAMERGRKGGRVPKGFFEIIRQWVVDKGITVSPKPAKRASKYSDEERAQRSAAGAIAYTIMTKGTRLFREGSFDDIYSAVIAEEVGKLRPKLLDVFSFAIRDINENMKNYENTNN